jgi:tetratricopeptide (TPR) repeat protein
MMKVRTFFLAVVLTYALTAALAGAVAAREAEDYINEARELQQADDLGKAVEVMQAAALEYPEDSNVNAYLGLYTGMSAGRTSDYMEAGRLVTESFEILDRAVALDHDNVLARYFRGIMGVSVPEFLGKRDQGIRDLQYVVAARDEDPESVSDDVFIEGLKRLGQSLMASGDVKLAKIAYEKLIEAAPGTESAEAARKAIEQMEATEAERSREALDGAPSTPEIEAIRKRMESDPKNAAIVLELGRAYMAEGDLDAAEVVIKDAIDLDPSNADAYVALADLLGHIAGQGYNEKIYEDTDYMTNLAFEVMRVTDKAVELDPENLDMRLMRGVIGVQMPFFVGRLDDAIEDLTMLSESDAPDSVKAQALFWLGQANLKKTMTYWIRTVSEYPDEAAARLVFDRMNPDVKHIDLAEYDKPIVVVEFVLGFKDELAPQTVVWVERPGEEFVKTVYVSGFSGFAKEQQINLPVWSSTSDFMDADGVTAASIDLGHHIYVWDLKDHMGKQVEPGDYVVKVETCYWPSMKYQMVEAPITIGDKETKTEVQEGNFIPYLGVTYVP